MTKRETMALTKYAAMFARLGGHARAKALTPTERRRIARKAAGVRWTKFRRREQGSS